MSNIIEISNLTYKYEGTIALEQINLNIPMGAFLGIVGPNGSGKSTLLKNLLGLLSPQEGSIKIFGEDSKKFKEWDKIGYVSQKANSFNSGFPATVLEVVTSGLTPKIGLFRFVKKEHKEKALEVLREVGMDSYADRNIGELSGGQQQRVFIARTLIANPKLIILDEPTVGIDAKNVESFYRMLENLNKNLGISLIMVSHDISAITDKVTHVACLNRTLHFHGEKEVFKQLTEKELSPLYGHNVKLLTHDHVVEGEV